MGLWISAYWGLRFPHLCAHLTDWQCWVDLVDPRACLGSRFGQALPEPMSHQNPFQVWRHVLSEDIVLSSAQVPLLLRGFSAISSDVEGISLKFASVGTYPKAFRICGLEVIRRGEQGIFPRRIPISG